MIKLTNEYGIPLRDDVLNQIDVMYLRKSREDAEAEKYGQGETLTTHYNILTNLAKRYGIVISENNIFRELVSAESIDARPEMQKLLKLVESGVVRNVFVAEVERLARGDTSDQGRVAKTFKYSHTKIITPVKVYDPDNEFDNEYFEFGLFMSRREYLTINRRLTQGKHEGTREGRYIGSTPPYGYDRIKRVDGKGYTLVPNENAKHIKMIYEMCLQGNGAIFIAKTLQDIGAPTMTGGNWSAATVRNILQNKTYCGYVSWQRRKTQKNLVDGVEVKKRKRNDKAAEYFKGLHEPIIDEETWERAQEMRENRALPSCNDNKNGLRNPLAGLIKCGYCGRTMQTNTHQNKRIRLRCPNLQCDCGSTYIDFVEKDIIEKLQDWLHGYTVTVGKEEKSNSRADIVKDAIENMNQELQKISVQYNKACELLELGVYDNETFISRSQSLKNRQTEINTRLAELQEELASIGNTELHIQSLPKVQNILDNYFDYDTKTKNMLLKEILNYAVFKKEKGTSLVANSEFDLEIFPKLPRK